MSTTAARWAGHCPTCQEPWSVGDPLRFDPEQGTWVHAACPEPADPLHADHPICTVCWLSHTAGGCDRE